MSRSRSVVGWALLECGDSSPLSVNRNRYETLTFKESLILGRSFLGRSVKAMRRLHLKESGDESPHSKDAASYLALRAGILAASVLAFFGGCERDMADQAKYQPYEASTFFSDGDTTRQPVAGTVARGHLQTNDHLYRGKVGNEFAATFPMNVDEKLLVRGQERFNVFCAHCHGPAGDGRGMVVKRGFPQPPSYHIQRLRETKDGYIFDVITNGFGRMAAHDYLIPAADRWAIIAYIRALQKSQHAMKDDLSAEDLKQLEDGESK